MIARSLAIAFDAFRLIGSTELGYGRRGLATTKLPHTSSGALHPTKTAPWTALTAPASADIFAHLVTKLDSHL